MEKQQKQALQEICVGAMQSILDDVTAPSQEDQDKMMARAAQRKKLKAKKLKEGGGTTPSKEKGEFFGVACSEDDTDDSDADFRKRTRLHSLHVFELESRKDVPGYAQPPGRSPMVTLFGL